jgi:phosphate transport system protein
MASLTNKQFEEDLNSIANDLIRMGGIVETMIADAIEAVGSGNMTLVEQVRENEKLINRFEVDLDERISQVLARHQPAAIDLRMLLAVIKMLTDMERSGDEAEKIATMARRIHEDAHKFTPDMELRHMALAVQSMLRETMDSFVRRDSVKAAAVVRSDKLVDREWKSSLRSLISYMIEDPRTISGGIDLLFVARSLERIGDHCKNMAERVIYIVHGADVRHQGVKKAERLVRDENQADGGT